MVEKSKLDEDPQGKAIDPKRYRGMIGTLMYLTASRHDLVFDMCMCARYQAKPIEKHLHALLQMLTMRVVKIPEKSTSGSMQLLGDRLEQAENGVVELYFVRTEYQLADIFTKSLTRERLIMNPQETQQVATRDEKWVPFIERVKISSTNVRLETTVPQKEETFQVVIDLIKNSSCFKAFTISTDVLEIFMQQFWYSIKKSGSVNYTNVPDDDTTLAFLIKLGYKGLLYKHTNMFVDHMHQPWRTLVAIINKCLSRKTTSNDKLRKFRIDILWGVLYRENVDYPKLIWEDLAFQIDHRKEKRLRRENMPFPRFTKSIINHFLKQHKSLSNVKYQHYHTIKDDGIVSRLNFVRIGEDYQEYGLAIPKETVDVSKESEPELEPVKRKTTSRRVVKKNVMISADDNIISDDPDVALELGNSINKTKAKKAEATRQVHATHARIVTESVPEPTRSTGGSSKGTGTIPGVPDDSIVVSATSSEGTGTKLGVPDKENDITKENDDKYDDADDEGNDYISDNQDVDDEDAETESDRMKSISDEEVTDAVKADAKKTSEVKDDAKKTELPPTSSSLSVSLVKIQSEVPHIQSPSMLRVQVSVIFEPSVLTPVQESPSIDTITTLPPPSVSTTPPLRVAKLEKDVSELNKIDLFIEALAALKTQVPSVVDNYLGSKVRGVFQKELKKYTADLIQKYSQQQIPKLYHALIESLIEDENAMDKGVADIVKDHKRKHNDDKDEDPSARPSHGKKTKRRRTKELTSSKKPSTTKETPKGKAQSKGSKTGKSASAKEPVEEPTAEVVMDDAGEDVVRNDDQPQDAYEPKTTKTLNPDWFKQPPKPPTPDLEWNKRQVVLDQPEQPWFNQMVSATKYPLTFSDLMATLIKFSKHDWNNPEGDRYPFDLSKPLPLQERTYTTSITKTKVARYEIEGIEDMVPTLWSPTKGFYKFKEGDFVDLHLNEIEDMLLLAVQHKLFHVTDSDIVDFIVALRMFTRSLIIKKCFEDLQLGDELHHRIHDFRLEYNKEMPRRKWTTIDKKRSELMVELIDKQEDLDRDRERGFDCLTFALVLSKAYCERCRAFHGGFPYCLKSEKSLISSTCAVSQLSSFAYISVIPKPFFHLSPPSFSSLILEIFFGKSKELNEFLSSYPIPSEYDVILATSTQTIFDVPPGYVGLYTHSFSLANLKLPLTDFFRELAFSLRGSLANKGLRLLWAAKEMAFKNFFYTEDDDDLAFLPKELSLGFGIGSPSSSSVNTELPKDVEEPKVQPAEVTADSVESPKAGVFVVHPGSVAAHIKERKCKTRGGSLRPPMKRILASGSSSSYVIRAKTSASKDDAPILSIFDDDEGKFLIMVDNAVNKRAHEFLQVIEKMSGEADVIKARERSREDECEELPVKCEAAMKEFDQNPAVPALREKISSPTADVGSLEAEKARLEVVEASLRREVEELKQDRRDVVSKVVPYAAMELVHSDELGRLVGKLVSSAITYGRCRAYEQVTSMKEPFGLSKAKGYRCSFQKKHTHASNNFATATFP
ncbi:hypothetical protein Tco_1524694 [Tanacetum coccineum]